MAYCLNPNHEQYCLINVATSEVIRGSVFELAQQLGCRVDTIQALLLGGESNSAYWGAGGFSGYKQITKP